MKRVVGILTAVFLTTNMFGQANLEKDDPAESNPSVRTHYVGEKYGGGIVFHVFDNGQHGLITAVVDASTRKQKYHRTSADTIDYSGGVAAGKILTRSFNPSGDEDSRVYSKLETESYSDWYLATRYDLIKLYSNRHVIGGYADFARGWKKQGVSPVNIWFQSFNTGARFTNGKDDAVYVRVVREF